MPLHCLMKKSERGKRRRSTGESREEEKKHRREQRRGEGARERAKKRRGEGAGAARSKEWSKARRKKSCPCCCPWSETPHRSLRLLRSNPIHPRPLARIAIGVRRHQGDSLVYCFYRLSSLLAVCFLTDWCHVLPGPDTPPLAYTIGYPSDWSPATTDPCRHRKTLEKTPDEVKTIPDCKLSRRFSIDRCHLRPPLDLRSTPLTSGYNL